MVPEENPDYGQLSLELHEKQKGKLSVTSKIPIKTKYDLSIAYTPGVAAPCREIAKDKDLAYKYTIKQNTVAIITDGSAVLGLGNIGPEAALPVMEGKAILLKEFANVDAFPICLDTQDTEEIIKTIKHIAPTFGGINLEDIAAPRCFEIERRLKEELDIPVFHDDQHGTAIVTLAALINALKFTKRSKDTAKIVLSGAGAAGIAIAKLLLHYGVQNITLCDSKGIIHKERNNLNDAKKAMLAVTNKDNKQGSLADAMKEADVFVGISAPNIVSKEMVQSMNDDPIIFAMANPTPEIMPKLAKEAGARVVATGRSDFPNQINNVLVFPGIFRGLLDVRAKEITQNMKIAAAKAIASFVTSPTEDNVIPGALNLEVAEKVAQAIRICTINGC
ncbi:NADP-dependent malic enzyme [archaeon]|jgi:malate dehydrogenase (oxaloacetate-decarboxylating)|nr:NADP-dependent malic enzyme [archaeon]MBT6698584.1 NADP-dependent malic enzyme [archaeon]